MRDQLESEGYCVAKGLLDPDRDIGGLEKSYKGLIDALLRAYVSESPRALANESTRSSFPETFAYCLGVSRGELLDHIDPVLNIFEPGFRWRPDLPDPRVPELFELIRNDHLIDAMEGILGPRITASPVQHVNMKLSLQHLKVAKQVAEQSDSGSYKSGFLGINLVKTHWHMDAVACLRDSHVSRIVNAWIPITHATEDNGCLRVIPRSHKNGVRYPPYPRDLDRYSVSLPVGPGDVIFIDNKLMHSSTPNYSQSDYRWAFNFRYLPTGQATGRPFLPQFVVKDRVDPEKELRDAQTWSRMWRGCLDYLSRHGMPLTFAGMSRLSPDEAGELTRAWREIAPDPASWANLSNR